MRRLAASLPLVTLANLASRSRLTGFAFASMTGGRAVALGEPGPCKH